MNCIHCGAMLSEGATFCPNCGQPVNANPYMPPQPTPPPNYNAYAPQQPYYGEPPVKGGGYLAFSIIVTVLCGWIFGIPAIVNAARINKCNQRGDFEGAKEAARKAKIWIIVCAVVGLVLNVLFFVLAAVNGGLNYSFNLG